MVTVDRLWPNSTIVCLATGPSLTQEDVDYVRGKARVICVNDAHRLAPWADVLYSSDRHWWPYYKGVPSFSGIKFGIGSGLRKSNPFSGLPDVRVLKNTGYDGLEMDPVGLRNGKNSGYAAINLAVHLGASRILLLGYDMRWRGDQAHFFGSHPPNLSQTSSLYPSFRRIFQTMVAPLAVAGVEVINCTDPTSLEAFPRGVLRDVLAASEVAA